MGRVVISPDKVWRAMRSLDIEAGVSGSGWHNGLLKGLARHHGNVHADKLKDLMGEHATRYASGEIPPWVLRLMHINRVVAGRKRAPVPGEVTPVRPFGIGCALRRLLSSAVREAHKKAVHAYCFPVQVAARAR